MRVYAAREELLVRLGVSTVWVLSTGNAMALSEQTLKYFTPLRVGIVENISNLP
jgi:hypothetical protein